MTFSYMGCALTTVMNSCGSGYTGTRTCMSGLFNMSASDTLEDNVLYPPIKKKRRLKRKDTAFQSWSRLIQESRLGVDSTLGVQAYAVHF